MLGKMFELLRETDTSGGAGTLSLQSSCHGAFARELELAEGPGPLDCDVVVLEHYCVAYRLRQSGPWRSRVPIEPAMTIG